MTKWNCSISATPPRIATPRSTSAAAMPQNSSRARYSSGTPKYDEQQQEDEQVVERQRALDEVDGRVGDRVVAGRESADTTSAASSDSTSQPTLQMTPSRKRRLAPAREEVQVDPEAADRHGREHDPGSAAREERAAGARIMTKKKTRPSTA